MTQKHSLENSPEPTRSNPWSVWESFSRSWIWALPVGILLAGVAAFVTMGSFQPVYRATHLLEANSDNRVFLGVDPVDRDLAMLEKDFLFNPIVIDPVLLDPSLRTAPSLSDPVHANANLLKQLSVKDAGKKSRMAVSYEDSDRKAAAKVCNAIVASYLQQRAAFDAKRVNDLENWIQPEIQRWETEVEHRQNAVKKLSKLLLFVSEPGDLASPAEMESELSYVSHIRTQLTQVTVKIAVLDAQAVLNGSELEQEESKTDPARTQSTKEMKRTRDLLAAERDVLVKKYAVEKSRLERLGEDAAKLQFAQSEGNAELQVKPSEGRPEVRSEAGVAAELQFAQAELVVADAVLGKLRNRIATIRTGRSPGSAMRSLAPASEPRSPVNSLPYRRMAIASVAAFLTPLLLGFLLGFRRENVPNID